MTMKLTGNQRKELRNRIQKRLTKCMLKIYECDEDDVAWWWPEKRVKEKWSCYPQEYKFIMSIEEVMDELMGEIELD